MKSKKLFGILIILFVVQVWASDDQHNKENVDAANKDHDLLGENSEKKQYDEIKDNFGKDTEDDSQSLLEIKMHDHKNLETNPKKNKNIHDLVDQNEKEKSDEEDSFQQKFEQKYPNIKFGLHKKFAEITISKSLNGIIENIQGIEDIQILNERVKLHKSNNPNVQPNLMLDELQLPQKLDLQQFTSVETLDIVRCTYVDKDSKLSLPKSITVLGINQTPFSDIFLTNLDNAHHVKTLVLRNLKIQDIQLQNFHSLIYLKLEKCWFDTQYSKVSKIMTPKETTVIWNEQKLNHDKDTAATFVTYTDAKECDTNSNIKKNDANPSFCLII